ncbi:hypothetical protein Tdes44962_MAKER00487 [Teratosphaeria destructans]|uniref:Uncharacterized protein n=1 Tax=Teratosphaeria destructans TaxID=418781 RepID=A0A9W7W162_9PEZI|nr:hypothetical protein Tdes44962_MAKER00487 [Teratosphaeria destructans]
MAVISVPMKAKAADMSTEKKPRNRPFAPAIPEYCTKPPVSFQYRNPIARPSGPPPAVMMTPVMIRPMTVMTLIEQNCDQCQPQMLLIFYILALVLTQNSHSPNTLVPAKLIARTTMSINPTHMALLHMPVVQAEPGSLAGVQYDTRTAAALISAGKTTILLNQ